MCSLSDEARRIKRGKALEGPAIEVESGFLLLYGGQYLVRADTITHVATRCAIGSFTPSTVIYVEGGEDFEVVHSISEILDAVSRALKQTKGEHS